jgi:hypothetical protein
MPAAVVYAVGFLAEYGAISAATAFAIGSFAMNYGAIIMLAGGLAYSASEARKAKSQARDAFNAAQVDRMAMVSSSVSPRELVMGRVRKAGSVFYKASTGANSRDMYIALALAGHEIDAVESIYLNDVLVTLDGNGFVTTAPYATSTTLSGYVQTDGAGHATVPTSIFSVDAQFTDPSNRGNLTPCGWSLAGTTITTSVANAFVNYQYTIGGSTAQVFTHLGASGQTVDSALVAAFASDWSSANVVQGVAYLVVKFTYSETAYPTGIPSVSAIIRGAKLYDPRTTTTVWSENPALMMRHAYTHPKLGKATVSASEDVRFIAAANACDTATVYTVGGVAQASRALYKASIVVPFGTAAKSVMDDLSQSMGGSWAFMGGELYLKPGTYTAPVMSLGDADLAVVNRNGAQESQSPIKISTHRARNDKFNSVKVTIWDAAQDYKQTTLTPLVGSALVTRDGAELVQEVSYPAIGYAPQALHVAGIMMRDARDPLTVELPFKLSAYPLELFDTVSLTLSRYGWSAKTFMVLSRTFTSEGHLLLTLKETTAAIVTMDAGFSAQGFAANTNLPKPWTVAAMPALTISSGTTELLKQLDGTIVSRMRVSWSQVPDAAVVQQGQVEVQYRRADSGTTWTSLVVAGNETSTVTADVLDGMTYIVRARPKTTLAVGDWSAQVVHAVLGKTEAPPPFDIFTVVTQPDGTRQYNFGYASLAAQPVDWLGAEIRYVSGTTSTPNWATMTPLQDTTTYYTNSPVELNAPLSGTWTFACKSLDTTGNESTYLVVNTELPDRRLGNIFAEYYEHAEGWLGTKTSCHVQQGFLEANDSTTWAGLTTWTAWTRWNTTPASPITYETPVRDFGTSVAGQINSTVDADGTTLAELATSADGSTWSAWGSAASAFSSRYIKLRLTVTATGPFPIPLVRGWYWVVNSPVKKEYINDVVISGLTGSYRIGVGDIRVPLAGAYSIIKRIDAMPRHAAGGQWSVVQVDASLSPAPRFQFYLGATLTDPDFVNFYIEGY